MASRYASVAVAGGLAALAGAPEGQRNFVLNRAAFNLGQLVGAGALHEQAVTDALQAQAEVVGLPGREAAATIASGLGAGQDRPRTLAVLPRRSDERLRTPMRSSRSSRRAHTVNREISR